MYVRIVSVNGTVLYGRNRIRVPGSTSRNSTAEDTFALSIAARRGQQIAHCLYKILSAASADCFIYKANLCTMRHAFNIRLQHTNGVMNVGSKTKDILIFAELCDIEIKPWQPFEGMLSEREAAEMTNYRREAL
ncbi:hypothetical protein DFH11DRAFT_1876748 [Phellopilus nigrolimitatus]|nr:hypothetical protein DFH11DRAFT_1876748 [Phellopilus nigrolimitatus]